jgi:hypothetical protein
MDPKQTSQMRQLGEANDFSRVDGYGSPMNFLLHVDFGLMDLEEGS